MGDAMAKRKICDSTGKIIYTRHQDAQKVLGAIYRRYRNDELAKVPRSAYQCEHCRRWHITSYDPLHTRNIQRSKRHKQRRQQPKVTKP
jgi:hypothetical protein